MNSESRIDGRSSRVMRRAWRLVCVRGIAHGVDAALTVPVFGQPRSKDRFVRVDLIR